MAKISDTTSYPNITPVADDYLILTDYNSSLATKTVTVDALSGYLFGNISVSLIPSIDCTYDIGSVTKKWRNLYLCGTASVNILTATTGTFATSFTSNGTTVLNGALSGTSLITSTTLAGASNTNIASTLAIKTYIEAGDDLGGSYDTSTTSVNIPTQSLRILGTANQITTTGDGAQTMQIAFPTNITTPGQLNSGGPILPTATATYNFGGTTDRWLNGFFTSLADENNSAGTALQFLRKSATNSGLEWANVASGSTLGVRLTSSATPTFTVDLATQDLGIVGTSNEIEVTNPASRTAALRLPTNITTRGQLNSLGAIIPTTNATQNLGSSVNRWQNFFTKEIVDASNGLGTAGQVLVKNAGNTGLEWVAQSGGGSMNNFKVSDSETPPNVTIINNSDSIIFAGTTNQLSVLENSGTLTFSFPTNITTPGQLNSGGAIIPTVDASFNLGGTAARWQNFFTEGIADGANSVGAAGQVLAKNAGNTALEWQTQAGGGSMNSWEFSDGTTAQTISNGNTATIAGTINEVEVAQTGGTATLRLPTNITTRGQINSLGPIIATTDKTQNLGGSVTRWRNFFTEGIADGQNNLGTAGQVLGKNAANTELEWVTQSGGGSMTSFSITDGAAPQTISDGDVITFEGTANQLVATTTATDTVTYSFPTNITTPGQLNSGGAILPTSDKTFNFGGTTDRWLNGFFDGLADGANSVGTAGQVLGKNAGNTALEWLTPATGTMSSWILSDGTTPETISNGNTATFSGTANEIELAQLSGTVTYRLPTDITTRGDINSLGEIIPTTDKTQDLGSSTLRWRNLWARSIADGADNLGTANQVLAKNAGNTGLEWQTISVTGMSSFNFNTEAVTNGDSLLVQGTVNEVELSTTGLTTTLRLPTNITTRGQINSLGPIIPTTDKTQNLGGSVTRWLNFFTDGIADGGNNLGTANQVLAKNAANTELEWVDSSSEYLIAAVNVTNALMKGLSTTPINIIPAPGAGKVIVLDSCLIYLDYAAPAFNFASDLYISYMGSNATQFRPFGDIQSNIINSSSSTYQSLSKVITDNTSNGQCRVNEGIKFSGPNTSTGGGGVNIKIRYRIEDLS